MNFCTSSHDLIFLPLPLIFANSAKNVIPLAVSATFTFQDSSGLKFLISLSLSTISFTATDCTLQADNHFWIFFHRTGLILNHTSLSSNLLDC